MGTMHPVVTLKRIIVPKIILLAQFDFWTGEMPSKILDDS